MMKAKKNHSILGLGLWALLSAVLFVSCSDKDDELIQRYLTLSADSFTFSYATTETFTFTVNSSTGEFEISDPSASWVSVTENGTAVSVNASSYDDIDVRSANFKITNSDGKSVTVNIAQLGKPVASIEPTTGYVFLDHTVTTVMSPEGKYLAYVETDNTNYTPMLIEIETGEILRAAASTTQGMTASSVSDNGEIICAGIDDNTYIVRNGVMTSTLSLPDGASRGKVYSISSNGRVWGGYSYGSGLYSPVIWNDDIPTKVATNKTADYLGRARDINVYLNAGISSDGDVIAGVELASNGPCAIVDGTFKYIAEDAIDARMASLTLVYMGTEIQGEAELIADAPAVGFGSDLLSANGEFIALEYTKIEQLIYKVDYLDFLNGNINLDEVFSFTSYPMIADVRNDSFKIVEDNDYEGYTGVTATNEGVLFFTYLNSATSVLIDGKVNCYAYDISTDKTMPAAEWIRNKTGLYVPDDIIISKVSNDGKTILGYRTEVVLNLVRKYFYIHL